MVQRFGSREICDVTFKALNDMKVGTKTIKAGQPVFVIDTAQTSSMEQATTVVYAQGGRGYNRLIAWEGEKTMTFNVTDALMSPLGLSMLTSAGIADATATKPIHVHTTIDAAIDATGKATVTLDGGLVLTAKAEGAVTTAVTMTVDATAHNDVFTYDAATGISIKLGTDKAGNVKDDFEKLAKKINEDLVLNSICVATVVAGKEADTPAAASGAFASGGATTVASDIDGILYHTVKVTDGEATGAMIIHGVINIDKMPSEPGAAIKAKLPHIQFARRD